MLERLEQQKSLTATLDALIPGMNYFAFWYVLAAAAIWFVGIETRGRTIQEIDGDLRAAAPAKVPAS